MANVVCTVVLGYLEPNEEIAFAGDVVGVDFGAYLCALRGQGMMLAIGDFDSIEEMDFGLIEAMSKEVVILEAQKDVSDFEAALERLEGYEKIIVYGGLGGRLDHQYSNMMKLNSDKRLVFINRGNKIFSLDKGTHLIDKETYTYVSVFALEPSMVSLKGFKYNLSFEVLDRDDTYTLSNEVEKQIGEITVHHGKLCVILSNDV